jgi:hypothetical protein
MSDRLAQPILPAVLILARSHCLRLIEREADKAEHQQRGEPERYAAEHMLLLCVPIALIIRCFFAASIRGRTSRRLRDQLNPVLGHLMRQ